MSDAQVAGDAGMADAYRKALRQHEIEPDAEIFAPEPLVPQWVASPEELCDQAPTMPTTEGESLPIRKLDSVIQEGSADYPGYMSFVSVTCWHPERGYGVMNHSYQRQKGDLTPLGHWVHDVLPNGGVFRIGLFKTSRGYKIIRPIAVGGASIAPVESQIPF
jgi:hypothetical protein